MFSKILLSLISYSLVYSIPSFSIEDLNTKGTGCIVLNEKEPSYKFSLIGTPENLTEATSFSFVVEAPTYGVARCTVFLPQEEEDTSLLECLVDGFFYEIGEDQAITLPDELPEYTNIEIKGWDKFIEKYGKNITENADCNDPEFTTGMVFEAPRGMKINYFGCFGTRNNFWFDVHKTKGKIKEGTKTLYFSLNINLNQGQQGFWNYQAYCTIPVDEKKVEEDLYTVYCSTGGYGGTIAVAGYTETRNGGNGPRGDDIYVLGEFIPSIAVETCY